MKAKALLTAVLLAATNFAWADGLSIDNVEQHMDADNWVASETTRSEIVAQGPIDQFDVVLPSRNQDFVDTNKLMQAYDGQS